MFKEINSMIKKFQPQLRVVKDKQGTILTENEEMKSRWKDKLVKISHSVDLALIQLVNFTRQNF